MGYFQDNIGSPARFGAPWRRGHRFAGFSLLELLISVALIFVMFVMLWSRGSKSRQAQLKTQCAQNLQHIHVALQTFAVQNTNVFPAVQGARTAEEPLSLLVPRYTTVTAHFICPGSRDSSLPEAKPFADRKISYGYYMGQTSLAGLEQPLVSDAQVNTLSKTNGQPLFSSDGKKPGNNHNRYGGNVMFCDGRVESSAPRSAFDLSPTGQVVLLNPKP